TGNLTQTATADETIDAVVAAASAAVSVGLVGLSASGAGASVLNQIATQVATYIDGDGATGINARVVTLHATDNSHIKAKVDAVSVALAVAPIGAGLSIAVAEARNDIANVVQSYITNAATGVRARAGNVDLAATKSATIDVSALAASIAGGVGAFSGGGISAT